MINEDSLWALVNQWRDTGWHEAAQELSDLLMREGRASVAPLPPEDPEEFVRRQAID
jgi:hypothetical protein